jgi:hypothetical protein
VAVITGVIKAVPVYNTPPVAAENQLRFPEDAVALNSTVPDPVLDPGVVPVTVGLAFQVMSAVLFALMTELQLLDEVSPLAL